MLLACALLTVPLSADIQVGRLRPRVPAFVEHAWCHRPCPCPVGEFAAFRSRYAALDRRPQPDDADLVVRSVDRTEAGGVVVDGQGYGQGSYDIDEIRVGIRWEDVRGGSR